LGEKKQQEQRSLYDHDDWRRPVDYSSSGRDSDEPYRSPARRDFARLIHCPAFRRLQGKTQLFPSHEGDFFRNRLTHSLEVAQIAKSIAIRFNATQKEFRKSKIDVDLVEFAGLAHDLGHPPFGHNGEEALDEEMLDAGGYEGNAQTLRILSRVEQKETADFPSISNKPVPVLNGKDHRVGLNLTYRTMASILKYDGSIPNAKDERERCGTHNRPQKGYYSSEKDIVNEVKKHVASRVTKYFKTIECSIMDVADDIAYSTYDLEDSFKAGFLSPISMMSASDQFKEKVAGRVLEKMKREYGDDIWTNQFGANEVNRILFDIFESTLKLSTDSSRRLSKEVDIKEASFIFSTQVYVTSLEMSDNSYLRTSFTSALVGRFVKDVEFVHREKNIKLSRAKLGIETFKIVETIKAFAYLQLIESPRFQIVKWWGKNIIKDMFARFLGNRDLLPEDWRFLYDGVDDTTWRKRVICDYISGMTDRYCLEVYSRLTGQNPMTIWKPH
jgi:dGTPase